MDKEIFLDDSTLYSDEKGNLPSYSLLFWTIANFFFTSLDVVSLESEVMLNTISVDSLSNFHMEIDSSITIVPYT